MDHRILNLKCYIKSFYSGIKLKQNKSTTLSQLFVKTPKLI